MYQFHIRRGITTSQLLPNESNSGQGSDLRAAERFDCNISATAYVNHTNFFCVITNISLHGAALFEKGFGEIKAGDRVKLMARSLDTLSGTVRWIGQTGFGIEFDEASLTSPRLKALISRLSEATSR